jgi:hypothetical protein
MRFQRCAEGNLLYIPQVIKSRTYSSDEEDVRCHVSQLYPTTGNRTIVTSI